MSDRAINILFALILFLLTALLVYFAWPATKALSRDLDGRYAQSPLKSWFDSLRSDRGPCCSDADGYALSDVDWETKDGHYRVRIEGQWFDVPPEAIITQPNLSGRTMVWPIYKRGFGEVLNVEIRCFMPGPMI
jgi:hypothetical protein